MSKDIYYVYEYYRDGEVYYVGKGCKSRYRDAHTYVDIPDTSDIIFAGINMSENTAYLLEEHLTRKYGLKIDGTGILENKVHGGKSSQIPSFTGQHHTEKSKRKISEGNKGKVRTEAHKENYRQPKTKEHAENIRQARIGTKHSEQRKKNISIAMKKVVERKKQQGIHWKQKSPIEQGV